MELMERVENGRDLALRMLAAFRGRDWVALLSERAGHTRDYIEWHLQQDMSPPDAVMQAAGELLSEAGNKSAEHVVTSPIGEPAMPMTIIATQKHYEAVLCQIEEMSDAGAATPEGEELISLMAAADEWENSHPAATQPFFG